MNWTNLGIGLSLVLVIEGLIPFVSPSRYHRMLEIASRLHERRLRLGGARMYAGRCRTVVFA